MASSISSATPSKKSPVVCVFCASSPGHKPVHLESARALGGQLHAAGYKLVYGGGTMGLMGAVSRTLVSLAGPGAVHGIIPRALIRTEQNDSLRNGEAHSGNGQTGDSNGQTGDSNGPADDSSPAKADRSVNHDDDDDAADPDSAVIPESEFGRTTIVPDMHTRKRMMARAVEAGGPGSGFVALAGGYGTLEEVMEMVTWNQLGIHPLPIVLVNIDGYYDGLLAWVRNSIRQGFVGPANADILVEVKSVDDVVPALKQYKVAQGRFKLDWTKS